MLKTLQVRLQQCVNQELLDVQAGFTPGLPPRVAPPSLAKSRGWGVEPPQEAGKGAAAAGA